MLLTKRVKGVVDAIKELDKLSARVLLDHLVEAFDIYEDHSDLTLGLREVLLSILDAGTDQTWNQNIDDRLKLLQLLDVSKLCDKTDFLLDLIPVCVVSPEKDVQGHSQSLPYQLDRTIFSICDILDRRQANVQESNS